ncbi:MAG TPA: fused MFS/spermidine synthase, partial [Bryobacteraceae bacterium]|nr:fused MFS/spermidine synthase [Bryobacteraceae bacterium]
LYAVSNLGSLVALLSYPVLIEPYLPVTTQLVLWSAGFVLFAAGCVLCGVLSWRRASPDPERHERPSMADVATWFALAAVPSVLWLAVGNQISQDVAAVPFLWIVPLALYLLTFVLCFDGDGWYRRSWMRWILPLAWAAMVAVVSQQGYLNIKLIVPALMSGLFICCFFCHGELARLKPDPRLLTAYYLVISAGGACGGLFVGLLAPRIFNDYLELPFGILACVLLALWLLYGLASKRVARIGFVSAAAALASVFVDPKAGDGLRLRNFYGAIRTADTGEGEFRQRALFNGSIQHGLQFTRKDRSAIPTSYYGRASGAAIALKTLQERGPVRVGVVGLGVGTMAAYARKGDHFEFYEINPAVVDIARERFLYLRETAGTVEVHGGDARLTMSSQQPRDFDLLIIDAFSGDSIPVHLLTREAFAEYFRHLSPRGAIAVHTTNKHLELEPVVHLTAGAHQAASILIHNSREPVSGIYVSSWVIVTRDKELQSQLAHLSSPIPRNDNLRPWTDDFSNLLTIIR